MSFPLKKLKFLIVYGPTQEPIDPVRFISNCSTGTMGKYLVACAKKHGHKVQSVECPRQARTALELQKLLQKMVRRCDVLIMAAAVCDVRPQIFSRIKCKKEALSSISLIKNPDILRSLGKNKKPKQCFVGFGIESSNIIERGREKLKSKYLDLIVMQKVTFDHLPFGECAVEAFFLGQEASLSKRFNSVSKEKLASSLISWIEQYFRSRVTTNC